MAPTAPSAIQAGNLRFPKKPNTKVANEKEQ